jgi:hypothetical protein
MAGTKSTSRNIRSVKHSEPINSVRISDSDAARFHAKYERRGDHECWLWTGAKLPSGYGTLHIGARGASPWYAHRIAYELACGSIGSAYVCHRCDQPDCVNPAHLFLGTHTDNMRDAAGKGRLSIPRRRNRARIAEIQQRWLAGGVTQVQLAQEYHTSKTQITRWLKAVKSKPYERRAS